VFHTLRLYFNDHFRIIHQHTLLTASNMICCLWMILTKTFKNCFLRTYFALLKDSPHTEKRDKRRIVFLRVFEMNCVKQILNTYHTANKLVSHIMCKKRVCLKTTRLFIEKNSYTLNHVEPGYQYQNVWITTTRLWVVPYLYLWYYIFRFS